MNYEYDLAVSGSETVTGDVIAMLGKVSLAANSHLVNTGKMNFIYQEYLSGGAHSSLTNNGSIMTEDGNISVAINGHGTLGFSGYHDGPGHSTISAPISGGQTVELAASWWGMTLELADARDFHGLLKLDPNPAYNWNRAGVSVVLDGVKATDFSVVGNNLTLRDGTRTVDTIRLAAGAPPFTAVYGASSTTLVFHPLA